MKVLGIIPARGGSKGIPRKNIRPVAGKPLLAWTAEAALRSRLDRLILSSDDEEIMAVAKAHGIEVPFRRPAPLAKDDTPGIDVVLHAVRTLGETEDYRPDAVMLLQPTSPLRRAGHIDRAIELLAADPKATSVVSVVRAPHNMTPESLMVAGPEGSVERLSQWSERNNLRQHKPVYYARNGAAVYLVRTGVLLGENTLFGKRILPLEMEREDSVDIDDRFDLEICEYLLGRRAEESTSVRGEL